MADLIPPEVRKNNEQIISEILVNYKELTDRENSQHFFKDVIDNRRSGK